MDLGPLPLLRRSIGKIALISLKFIKMHHRLARRLRIDEDELWVPPAQGVLESFGTQRQIKSSFKGVSFDVAKAFGKPLGIAVVATGADLGAAGDRVPGAVGPFDSAFKRHGNPITQTRALALS